jgi:hypothetical protein
MLTFIFLCLLVVAVRKAIRAIPKVARLGAENPELVSGGLRLAKTLLRR